MNKEEKYEAIEAYLEGELAEEARRAFEREMAADPELQKEVALHRKIHRELSKAGKAQLRAQLRQAAQEFLPEKEKGRSIRRLMPIWLAAAAAIIAAVIWWAWPRLEQASWEQGPALAVDSLPGEQTAAPDSLIAAKPEPQETAPPQKEEKPAPAPPAADPFRPNPRLESLVAQKGQNAGLIISASADAAPISEEKFRAIVTGTLRSPSTAEGANIELQIYDNQPGSYQKGETEASIPLELQQLEDEEVLGFGKMKNYTFEKEVDKELPPGLYYYVIKREGENGPLFVGKVEIKKDN